MISTLQVCSGGNIRSDHRLQPTFVIFAFPVVIVVAGHNGLMISGISYLAGFNFFFFSPNVIDCLLSMVELLPR